MNQEEIREKMVQLFDHARAEGMLRSRDGKHCASSDADAEDVLALVQPLIDQARQEGKDECARTHFKPDWKITASDLARAVEEAYQSGRQARTREVRLRKMLTKEE